MQTLTFRVVIPARLRSTRLPGKMLADIGGKPMVAWVAERAAESGALEVVIATDAAEIADFRTFVLDKASRGGSGEGRPRAAW